MDEETKKMSDNLKAMFSMLRNTDNIEIGRLCSLLGPIAQSGVLINRLWKLAHGLEMSELEKTVAEEAGPSTLEYIKFKYTDEILLKLDNLPFPRYDITIDTLVESVKKLRDKYRQ